MAIRKLSDVNLTRLKKTFQAELEKRGHNLTEFDLHGDEFNTQLTFTIDNFYKHNHNWASSGIIGKEFQEVVDEVLAAFDHDKHLERNGKRI